MKLLSNKKGIELTMQVVVVVILLLALLIFLLVFFTGRAEWLTNAWDNLVQGSLNETQLATR